MNIPVVVQHRHVHLSAADQARLFGSGAVLKPMADAGHRGQVVYRETVTIVGKHGTLEGVRVVGPCREETQLELSAADAAALGLEAPVRVSGDVARAAACGLSGPAGRIRSRACAIVPARHLHCSDADAQRLGLAHGDLVALGMPGRPELHLPDAVVRVHPTFRLAFHLTTDDAAAHWLHTGDAVVLSRSSLSS